MAEECYGLGELRTDWGQAVINVWRHYRMNKTIDDTPSLQLS
jgi:hypothetical protein